MNESRPWYRSKKFLAYVTTLGALVAAAALDAPEAFYGAFGQLVMFGLAVLLGGQALIDRERAKGQP